MLPVCSHNLSSPSAVLRRRVLARRAVRHAIIAGVTRLSRCSAARVQSQSIVAVGCAPSPCARSTLCPPCYNRWRHSPLALQCCPCAVTIFGLGFSPSPCSLDAGGATFPCWCPPLFAVLCCIAVVFHGRGSAPSPFPMVGGDLGTGWLPAARFLGDHLSGAAWRCRHVAPDHARCD